MTTVPISPPTFADEDWNTVQLTLEYADPQKEGIQTRSVVLDRIELEAETNERRAPDKEPEHLTPGDFKGLCLLRARELLSNPVLVRGDDDVRMLPPWNIVGVTISRVQSRSRIYVPS